MDSASVFGIDGWGFESLRAHSQGGTMAEETNPAAEGATHLQELQEELGRLKQQEREIEEQIARLQAEMSRTQGQGRRRAEITRSSALPALQMQQRRLRAGIFRTEQEIRGLREQSNQKE